MRLDPHYPPLYLYFLGVAYHQTGQPEAAVTTLKRGLFRSPSFIGAHIFLAAIYAELDRLAEARAEIAAVQRLNPQISLETLSRVMPFKDRAVLERYVDALRKAGLK